MYYPLRSLREGNWFKLICGASFQHLPAIRSLTLAYTLAGVDCIDVAADPAIVNAVRNALQVAESYLPAAKALGFAPQGLPWLMVSLNDGEDPHFRKAELLASMACLADCAQPCVSVCPTQAVVFDRLDDGFSGVLEAQCYGCGRCLPLCPVDRLIARSYVSTPSSVAALVLAGVDAVEIHTQVGRFNDFQRLWQSVQPFLPQLKLVSVSCPDDEGLLDYLRSLYELMSPLPCVLLWQTDGRPMSGDIGDGATRAAVKLSQKVLSANLPGYVQLAGGTNRHTVEKLAQLGLLKSQDAGQTAESRSLRHRPSATIAGIAYGSYARTLLSPLLQALDQFSMQPALLAAAQRSGEPVDRPGLEAFRSGFPIPIEEVPELLWQAVSLANSLVAPLKAPRMQSSPSTKIQPASIDCSS